MFNKLIILVIIIKQIKANADDLPDVKYMHQQLLDAQSNAQIKNLYTIGLKMLKRMQIQNEQSINSLDECHERLGKFTRLMVINNKRRALINNNNSLLNQFNDDDSIEFNNNSNNNDNLNSNKNQHASLRLLNEINFYL
jgi:hypothetical protein